MGLFDKMKKKTEDVEFDEELLVGAQEQEGNEEKAPEKGGKFTLVIEETFQLANNEGIMVAGILHGKAMVEDAIYVIHPNGRVTMSVIKDIEVDKGEFAKVAEDQPVRFKLADIKNKDQIQRFTVLTTIRPQSKVDVNQAVENVHLLALTREFPKFNQDSQFMSLFVYVLCHANFITPVHISKDPERQDDGSTVFTEGTTMGFLSLTHPSDENQKHLPIFTDWEAVRNWKAIFKQEKKPKLMIVRFPDVVSVVKKDLSGAVLNAFGPVPVILSNEYIDKITALEGYKAEFIDKEKAAPAEEPTQPSGQIVIGVPAETDEVKHVRAVIVEEAKPMADINQVYMLLKLDQTQKRSYLLVVDCDKEKEMYCFSQIAAAVRPYLNEVKNLDMITYEKFGERIKGMDKKALIFDRATFWK